ncbi:DUF1850 domain-containing protein [Auritidibacter ignavus]|nr:DUF1850 domain-containing protein [Auritidibacter ignavus]RMX22894.1 DUF1850 domain-containing protein [Auritidibacter ignavus]
MTPPDISRRSVLTLTVGTVLAVAGGCGVTASVPTQQRQIVCRHQQHHDVYATLPAIDGTTISLSWAHSIELTPWTDIFTVTPAGLVLTQTRFSSYGAGMPAGDQGDLRYEGNQVVIDNIDRPFDAIRWIHSHRAQYRVLIDHDPQRIDAKQLPDHQRLEIVLI